MVSRKSLVKSLHIKTFKNMSTKPATPKKGVVFFVEPIKTMTNDPTIKGDVFKKFVNGKLVKQVFVSKNRMKKIVKTAQKKAQKKTMGGKTRKIQNFKRLPTKKNVMRVRGVQKVQPQYIYVNQPPQQQNNVPVQQIVASDNTTMGQAAKQGLAGGIGFFTAEAIIKEVANSFNS